MEFKDRIRQVRGLLTQRECAKRLGIHTSTWQQYENGNIPKGDILQRIHDEFHVDLNWLLTGQEEVDYKRPPTGIRSLRIGEPRTEYGDHRSFSSGTSVPIQSKEMRRRKGEEIQDVSAGILSREELALIRSLRLCGDEYRKRVYNAVAIRAKNVLEEKALEPEKSSELREDLEILSLSSIQ
jgi:transcriptional regulator with XRE-family HTH domain